MMNGRILKTADGTTKLTCFLFISILCLSIPALAWANSDADIFQIADEEVSGTVLDASTGETLPGVNISVKGTTIGTSSTSDGSYSLTVPSLNDTLVFSFVGYHALEVPINGRTEIDAELQPETIIGDELVVIGYGTQSRREVTGSVQSVEGEGLEDMPVAQLSQKLQGKLAGVQIKQTTGKPGQGMNIRIRGAASINAGSEPLYVIDGFPVTGGIDDLNPNQIESISVLKDASATALYGSRAANGVVLIETKQGQTGETQIDFRASYGFQQVPQRGRPDVLNAREFATFQKEIHEERGASVPEEYQNPEQYGAGTDWYDVLLRTGHIENYDMTISTGTENLSTSVMGGYMRQSGVMLTNDPDYQRFSIRANSQYQFSEKVSVGLNVAPTFTTNSGAETDGFLWDGSSIQSAILTSPLAEHVNEDGTMPLTATSPGMFPNPNWYRVAQEVENDRVGRRILSNGFLEAELLDGLSFKSTMNVDWGSSEHRNFNPSTAGQIFAVPPVTTTASINNSTYLSWLTEQTLTYQNTFGGDHNIEALAGFTAQKYEQESESISGSDFPDDRIKTLNAASSISIGHGISEWALLSWVSRFNYNYQQRYLISLALRRDGSSRFGSDNRWGNFPSISAGWVISDESFMENIQELSFLKLRASYGITGNNDIGNYAHYANVTGSNYVLDDGIAGGRSTSSLGNQALGWESTEQYDVGFDLSLFDERVSLTYDYFQKYTTDMLYEVDVAQESGYDEVWTNTGEFNFWGHEFQVSTQNLADNLQWNTDFNLSFIRNRVEDLGPDNEPLGGQFQETHVTRVGSPVGLFNGFVHDGVYMTEEEFQNSPTYSNSDVGTAKMRDLNGDGEITNDDVGVIGNPNPKFTFGMTNYLAYENFDLRVVIEGSYGNDIMKRYIEYTENLDGVFNVSTELKNRWRSPENPGDGIHPRANVGTDLHRFNSSHMVQDGSYLAVKNITLGYSFPFENNPLMQGLRLYGSLHQAFILTNYDGPNPEVSYNGGDPLAQGIDNNAYPIPRTFTLGLNMNF